MIARDSLAADVTPDPPDARGSVADIEIALLLEGIRRLAGYDFSEYAPTSLKRRVTERVRVENTRTITGLLERVVHDPAALEALLYGLTTTPSVPFRDAATFTTLANAIVPRLRTYPFFRIWVAGNAADAFPVAILLHEAKVLSRARIYATEATDSGLAEAKSGVLRPDALVGLQARYEAAGGRSNVEEYIDHTASGIRFVPSLTETVLFARHDLASEGSFNEFESVLVRTSLASYGRSLAYRVHRTLFESTARLGFLCVASPDGLTASPHRGAFESLAPYDGVWRRVR
ncbi:MAG: chemotaxis protein CheR [Vulcanimicrobiaceae bacterium]